MSIDHDNFCYWIFKHYPATFGLEGFRFHDLRHTAITRLVREGVSPWVIESITGHKNIKTTMRYVHVVGKDVSNVGELLSEEIKM